MHTKPKLVVHGVEQVEFPALHSLPQGFEPPPELLDDAVQLEPQLEFSAEHVAQNTVALLQITFLTMLPLKVIALIFVPLYLISI